LACLACLEHWRYCMIETVYLPKAMDLGYSGI